MIVGFFASLTFVGAPLAVAFFILWLDAVLAGVTKRMLGVIGFELISLAMILIGMVYDPTFTFFFGFFVIPLLAAMRWCIATPYEPEWPPGVPSPDSAVGGILGVSSALLTPILPFILVVVAVMIIRIPLVMLVEMVLYGSPFKPGYIFDIPITVFFAHLLAFVITL